MRFMVIKIVADDKNPDGRGRITAETPFEYRDLIRISLI